MNYVREGYLLYCRVQLVIAERQYAQNKQESKQINCLFSIFIYMSINISKIDQIIILLNNIQTDQLFFSISSFLSSILQNFASGWLRKKLLHQLRTFLRIFRQSFFIIQSQLGKTVQRKRFQLVLMQKILFSIQLILLIKLNQDFYLKDIMQRVIKRESQVM
ncbi:hypothetical protein ABPG74_019421 [Tetrahymena malaccensis]